MKISSRIRPLLIPLSVMFLLIILILVEFIFFPQLIRSSIAKLSYDRGNYSHAEKTFADLSARDKADSIAAHNLAKTYYKQDKPEEAEKILKDWESRRKTSADLLYDLGNTAFKANDYDKAISYYERALLADPADRDTKANLELAIRKQNEKQKQKQPPQPQEQPPQDNKDKKHQPKENEDYRNILNALDQKEALDRQNKQKQQDKQKGNWW